MVILLIIVILVACIITMCYTLNMKKQNFEEYEAVEDLKKRIDELDNDNVDVASGQTKATIIVPDIVDSNESTRISTQKEECKVYEVRADEKIEKKVIGSKKQEKDFVNTEIERVEDKEENPIKENKGFFQN